MKTLLNLKHVSLIENSLVEIDDDLRNNYEELRVKTGIYTKELSFYNKAPWYKKVSLQNPIRSPLIKELESINLSIDKIKERQDLFSVLKKALESGETIEVDLKKINL